MKFEELYEKYLDGTATEEEREYVEGEIEKARKLNDILDRQDARRVIEPVEEDEVKKAQKAFNFKALIRTVVVVTVVFLLMAGGVLGGVFSFLSPLFGIDTAAKEFREYYAEFQNGDAVRLSSR